MNRVAFRPPGLILARDTLRDHLARHEPGWFRGVTMGPMQQICRLRILASDAGACRRWIGFHDGAWLGFPVSCAAHEEGGGRIDDGR